MQAKKAEGRLTNTVLLVDEASMVNSELFYRLLLCLKKDCVIILVGDPAQLPPIGAGDPFHNIIKMQLAPVIELVRIYRQRTDQVIALFANNIREGSVPPDFKNKYSDFKFIDVSIKDYFAIKNKIDSAQKKELRDENSRQILSNLLNAAGNYLPGLKLLFKQRDMQSFITSFQVITPIKSGILGTVNLNIRLQELINPVEDNAVLNLGRVMFHLFDKVVHVSNMDMDCYDPVEFKKYGMQNKPVKQRIFNGMIGILFKIDRVEELIWIFYPGDKIVAEYTFDEARDLLKLAYALTIHKTQGSEYQNVIIPMSYSHFIMLNNKLLYTAITRAKKHCCIIGEYYAFTAACKRKDAIVRDTVMKLLE